MTKRIDYVYYDWLVKQVDVRSERTYGYVFERMHNLEFVWILSGDDNRVDDAKALRHELLDYRGDNLSLEFVTILEVLIALSRRVAFQVGGSERLWAWRLMKNIGLNKMSDPVDDRKANRIEDILDTLIWRTYRADGRGGFFPLKNPKKDQTKIQIWDQMQAYVLEILF